MKIEVEKGDLSYANDINMTLVFPESFTASDFNMFFTSIKAYRNKQISSLEVNKTAKEFLALVDTYILIYMNFVVLKASIQNLFLEYLFSLKM
ncbi:MULTISPECIES: hypothetical protein [Campylobacter]|uniref:hypothetical protein n=1 Tax=Campylobacter TaxID=194 RepID=UPI000A32B9EE|nr:MULTISPECIES: hypothetical protein [unclassified Campylobacter]